MSNEKSKSILIVNSDPDIADLFAEMLLSNENNYIVTTTFTGKGCLWGINKNKPDMVLMDIELPDMNGWNLTEKIKANNPDMPIVVITSKIPGIKDMLRLSHVSDYLMKPVTLDGLQMAVKDAFEIPSLLDQCYKTVIDYKENENMMYLFYLFKQNIIDRKRFILMRQLYSTKKLVNDPESKKILDNLKEKINASENEIKHFKNKPPIISLFSNFEIGKVN
ncbi:putative transcriptional regulatory protein TcrX [Methanosarcinales archaeon]|nr:response regulator [Candidatus Methanoperedens sp.]CAG0969331.1 putative transcriptional regulatory protein TcrX [Methanosarcinales archaeon]